MEKSKLTNWLAVGVGSPEMRLNRAIAIAWGIVIADEIVLVLSPNIFGFNSWPLRLQFFIVVAILWRSLWVARFDRDEKSLTNWQAVKIGIIVGLGPIALGTLFVREYLFYGGEINIYPILFTTVFFLVAGMPICILGAFIGKKLRNTPEATWGTAIVSSILALMIVIVLMAAIGFFGQG